MSVTLDRVRPAERRFVGIDGVIDELCDAITGLAGVVPLPA
jgi:hypothetical protein